MMGPDALCFRVVRSSVRAYTFVHACLRAQAFQTALPPSSVLILQAFSWKSAIFLILVYLTDMKAYYV